MMQKRYDAIYLSPHLDDAILSCGGQIFQQAFNGRSVLILTIMAGDPPQTAVSDYATSLHERWELATDIVEQRREEDKQACTRVGADYRHWDVPDCIYRLHSDTNEPLYVGEAGIFGEVHPAEQALIGTLAERLQALPPAKRVYAPLTIGHHVDHQLVRLAAEAAFGQDLVYYEDYPYVQQYPEARLALADENDPAWKAEVIPLSEAAVLARTVAISDYKSQLSTFFADATDLRHKVQTAVLETGGERLWHRQPAAT